MAPHVSAPTGGSIRYTERLTVPWWLWPLALGATAILAAEIGLGAPGLNTWGPYAVLLPAVAIGVWRLGRIRIAVADGQFWADDAHLPVHLIRDAIPLDAAGRRELLGVGADPLAFVIARPWIAGAVQVLLNDPGDPTPYWVISSRHPSDLAAALLAPTRPPGADPPASARPANGSPAR